MIERNRARTRRNRLVDSAARFLRPTATALIALAVGLPLLDGLDGGAAAAQGGCQTPFLVFTDPDNPGTTVENGPFQMVNDSRLLGDYWGDGRFAGYSIDGS